MGFEETKKSCRRMTKHSNLDELFGHLDEYTAALRKNGGEDIIPHQVLSHGFMEWGWILGSIFPCLRWRGQTAEGDLSFEQYERFLYDRFFLRIAELPSLRDMSEEKKKELKEAGWQAYLDD